MANTLTGESTQPKGWDDKTGKAITGPMPYEYPEVLSLEDALDYHGGNEELFLQLINWALHERAKSASYSANLDSVTPDKPMSELKRRARAKRDLLKLGVKPADIDKILDNQGL